MAAIRFKRGTRAQLNTAATANGLAQGEPYLISDESRVAIGTAAGAYKAFVREDDAVVAPQAHAAASKAAPADADELPLVDSAASNVLKKLTFANLAAWVRGVALTGLSTATNAVVVATDSILVAVGKLQAQVSAKLDKTGGDVDGNINFTGTLRQILGNVSLTATTTSGPSIFATAPNTVSPAIGIKDGAATQNVWWIGSGAGSPTDGTFFIYDQRQGMLRLLIDTSGNVLVPGGVLGYGGTGAGGTVTQSTSKSTNVALNKAAGRVTMNNAALPGGATVSFQITNTLASQYDGVILTGYNSFDWSSYILRASIVDGGIIVTLKNDTIGSRSEALVFNFQLVRGAVA